MRQAWLLLDYLDKNPSRLTDPPDLARFRHMHSLAGVSRYSMSRVVLDRSPLVC